MRFKKMNVTIAIHYTGASRILQRGEFPLRGQKPEKVALDFWKQIQKDMPYRVKLDNVIVNGDEDITELVKELEESEWRKAGLSFNQ
jgi:hypothetical protein